MTAEARGVIRLAHPFAIPADRVFDAWLCPEKVARWLHPDAVEQATRVEIDARVGGSIRAVTCRAGRTVEHTGEYLEIQRPHRLVFTIRSSASAATERVTVLIEPRGAGCFLTLISGIEPASLRAFAPVAGLGTYGATGVVRPHWPKVDGKAAVSLGLHLAMLPLLPIILREPPPQPGAGTLPALAMITVDLDTAAGRKLPERSYVPAVAAPGEPPAMAAPPAPAPQAATSKNALLLLPSPTTRHHDRAADNRTASAGWPGSLALDAAGAATDPTKGAGLTASTGGAVGEDGDALRRRARAASAQVEAHLAGTNCSGTVSLSPNGSATYWGGQQAPVQGRFFRDQSGKTWIRFTLWPGAPWNLPVTIAGSEIRWTAIGGWNGFGGITYTVRPAANNHLVGFAGFSADSMTKIDVTCGRSDADAG